MNHILTLFILMGSFLALDLLWLGIIAKNFYREHIGGLLLENFNIPVAATFYLFYVIGIYYFAVLPGIEKQSWEHSALQGALFGFFCYATYDLTNLSTLKGWSWQLSLVDIAWGTFLTCTVAICGYFGSKLL